MLNWRSYFEVPHPRLRQLMRLSVIGLGLGAVLLVVATVWPIDRQPETTMRVAASRVPELSALEHDVNPLLGQMAGRRLIRPAQVQAAVRDTGAAQRLLGQLKLQGVVQMGDSHVAYVRIEKRGTQTVRKGDRLLEFVVESVEPGTVGLSLEGVQVALSH